MAFVFGGERVCELLALFPRSTVSHRRRQTVGADFTPVVHVSGTADAGFSNCSRALATSQIPEFRARSERRGWPPAKTLRCLSQWFFFALFFGSKEKGVSNQFTNLSLFRVFFFFLLLSDCLFL
ncbi:hypothetical protein PanWU01x14_065570, partial [Parasponia andersonii]